MTGFDLRDPFILASVWVAGGTCILFVVLMVGYAILDRFLKRRERGE